MEHVWEIWVLEIDGERIGRIGVPGRTIGECAAKRIARNVAHLEWNVPFAFLHTRTFRHEGGMCEDMGWGDPYDFPVPVVMPELFTLSDLIAAEQA